MTPQASFMILAAIEPQREVQLRQLLASMNHAPGRVNPNNALIPFEQFDTLHFARLLVVDDKTIDDIRVYGITPGTYPLYLTFLGDIDFLPAKHGVDSFLQARFLGEVQQQLKSFSRDAVLRIIEKDPQSLGSHPRAAFGVVRKELS